MYILGEANKDLRPFEQSPKGQLSSEWVNGSLSEGRAEISVIFGLDFGRNDDLQNSFWI